MKPAGDRASPAEERAVLNARLILVAITVAGAVLRLAYLGDKSLWFDEAVLFGIADRGVGEVVAENVLRNSAPPLFALLLSGILRLASSEFALRSIACAAGIATIPAVYALARRYVGTPWALLGALLVALSPQQVAYSQQVREYSLTALLATLVLLASQAFLDHPGRRQVLALGAATTVALVTQYGLGLLLAAVGLISIVTLIRSRASGRVWGLWVGVQAVGLATVGATAALGLKVQLTRGAGGVLRRVPYLESGYWDGSILSAKRLILNQTARLFDFAFPSVLFVFLCLLGVAVATRERQSRMAVLLFVAPIVVTLGAAFAHLYPYNGSRHVIFLTPMFYVMAAIGLAHLGGVGRWPRGAVIATVLLAGMSFLAIRGYYGSPGQEPLRPIVAELLQRLEPGDKIFVSSRSQPAFAYYVRGTSVQWESGPFPIRRLAAQAVAEFDSLLQNPAPRWLVFSEPSTDGRGILLPRIPPNRRVELVRELGFAALYRVESP